MRIGLMPDLNEIVDKQESVSHWNNFFAQIQSAINQGDPAGEVKQILATTGIQLAQSLRSSLIRVISATAGDCPISVNPQISKGFDAQELTIEGADSIKTVTLSNGNGLQLKGATSITLALGDVIKLHFNANRNIWIENYRSINH